MAHSLASYRSMLTDLATAGFRLCPVRTYFDGVVAARVAYLRHDVDRLPRRAVAMAVVEAKLGVASTYYFRCDAQKRFPTAAIARVQGLGHEIGFHYESFSRTRGDASAALALFERELKSLRDLVPVATIAPHGAPLSASSNMEFADGIGLDRFNLIGDATAIDFSSILYVTDTGGTFGSQHNLRDRVDGRMLQGDTPPSRLLEHIRALGESRVVISCHPERWPASALGLAQARLQDLAVNAMKKVVGGSKAG